MLPLYVLNLAYEKYHIVFIYTSLIIYPAIFYLIYKNFSNLWISTTDFLCFLRQIIAALIVTYAVQYLNKRKLWRFLVLVIAAAYINCLMYTVVFETMGTRYGILSRFALLVYLPAILYLVPDMVIVIKGYISEKFASAEKRVRTINIATACADPLFALECFLITTGIPRTGMMNLMKKRLRKIFSISFHKCEMRSVYE